MLSAMLAVGALILGCTEAPRQYSEAEIKAAQQAIDSITADYATKKDVADIDRLIDNLRIVASCTNVSGNVSMPLMGFLHGAFAESPQCVSRWLG